MAFDVDGRITGSDDNGCVYSGSVAIGSAAINIYQISLIVESCSIVDATYIELVSWRPETTNILETPQ